MKKTKNTQPCVLTIAGSDSGGGAGIQADIKTISSLDGYAVTAITALTAQNGLGVTGIHTPDPDFLELQLNTIFKGFPIAAVKIGMLFSTQIILAVKTILQKHSIPIILDPVSVSQTGHSLLQQDALEALQTHMLPLATIVTPNKPEAELLTKTVISSDKDIILVGEKLLSMGAQAVLIKGGHFEQSSEVIFDWYIEKSTKPYAFPQKFIQTSNTHGTGCTLSSAIATYVAHGLSIKEAIPFAQQYLSYCLQHSYAPGEGVGPPHHLAWTKKSTASY